MRVRSLLKPAVRSRSCHDYLTWADHAQVLSSRPLDDLGITLKGSDLGLDALVFDLKRRRFGGRLGVLGPCGFKLRPHLAVIREADRSRGKQDHDKQAIHDSVGCSIACTASRCDANTHFSG